MRSQPPKPAKRPSPKGSIVKAKAKVVLDKKRKIVIRKLVVGKQKNPIKKCIAVPRGASIKVLKVQAKNCNKATSKPKIVTKKSPSKHQSSGQAQKKKLPAASSSARKTPNSPSTSKGQTAVKTIKKIPSKTVLGSKVKKVTPIKQDGKEVKVIKKCKPQTAKEKSSEGGPSKSNAKNNKEATKPAIKKSGDGGQSMAPNKADKEKDRSRSVEKKKVGVTRSSSAPLIPSQESIDSAAKDAKSFVVTRTNKASLENIAAQSGELTVKAALNRKLCIGSVPQMKSKDSEAKSPAKVAPEKSDMDLQLRRIWSEDPKNMEETKSLFSNDETLLSPLGKKKLVGKVKPIARVKGTIIEKKVELEKRKITNSPAKIVDEKAIAEKESAEKLKTDLEKAIDESKKLQADRTQPKQLKSPKRDLSKLVAVSVDKDVMIVQTDVSASSNTDASKSDNSISKVSPKSKTAKPTNIRKVVKMGNIKLVTKSSRALLSNVRSAANKRVLVIRKPPITNKKIIRIAKKPLNASNKALTNKKVISPKVVKTTATKSKCGGDQSKSKSKDNIPKNIKVEPKDDEVDDSKKKGKVESVEIKKELISQTKSSLSNANVEQGANKLITTVDKAKAKLSKAERSPSPKVNKVRNEDSDKSKDCQIKKEKCSADKSKSPVKEKPKDKKPVSQTKYSGKSVKKFVPIKDNVKAKKLLGFWTGPKRHREASLNALAKVQCLYENESRSHSELGLMRTVDKMPVRSKEFTKKRPIKVEKVDSASSESEYETRVKPEINSSEDDSDPPTMRKLRCQPGSRGAGKYWEKISSSEESESELRRCIVEKKKVVPKPKIKSETPTKSEPKSPMSDKRSPGGSSVKKRRKRTEIVMDLKDMVVKKRMASLNATAILAASYEKRSPRSSRDETTSDSGSSEQEEARTKKSKFQISSESAKSDYTQTTEAKTATKAKVEMIVNQEADVTITGVYSHHESYCTVSGLQYRISSTSHTQTLATATAEKELAPGGPGPASYTPLGALSSMHPPGGQGVPHPHQGPLIQGGPLVGSLGRRAGCSSAFSAPHHHSEPDRSIPPGYYQPAGPLITATPLHGGFKDGGGPPSMQADQASQFGRYPYAQPQQMVHYGGGFGGQYAPHSHYGAGEMCYGAGRPPGAGPAPPPSCYRPPAAHRTASVYRHSGAPGSGPMAAGSHDNQLSPAAPEAYAPSYCPPCYQHPHAAPRAPIAFIDPSYQGPCPCPMQSCPKNVHTGPATGNPPAGGGPIVTSPPGGSRAPAPPPPMSGGYHLVDDKRKGKITNGKDPPLLNQVLKNECSLKNGGVADPYGRPPKLEYFPERAVEEGRCCAVAINPSLSVIPPEPHGPPSPARGSAGASIPQPPDPPHPFLGGRQQPSPLLAQQQPRRARVGKAMVRKSIGVDESPGHATMLLMCQPPRPQPLPEVVPPPASLRTPLKIITESREPKNDDVKSDVDSGDDVILLDSPSSKMAPIDLSSSEENNGNDSKSEKDCSLSENIIDLSVDTKKENSSNDICGPAKKNLSDAQALKEHNVDNGYLNSGNLKKISDTKSKVSTKRRCSQPKLEIDLDVQIDDSLAANGICEHVKLQKRQKVSLASQPAKKNGSGSYKDLIKKPEKVFKLNNGKRQLNTIKTEKPDKSKQGSKEDLSVIDCDKTPPKKTATKRKSASPPASESPIICKRKKASLLKTYTEKKQQSRQYDDMIEKPIENNKKKVNSLMPKNKSDGDSIVEIANTEGDSTSLNDSKTKKSKQNQINSSNLKNRTVLNINNNVVKKLNESDSNQVPALKSDAKATVDKRKRTKSKSPAPLNWKSDKNNQKDTAAAKVKCQVTNMENKDGKTKADGVKSKKSKGKIATMSKNSKKKCKVGDANENGMTELLPARRLSTLRWSNGWTWEGEPQQGKVFINNEGTWLSAWCYSSMRHSSAGDSIRSGDCVLLRAGARRTESPFVARVTKLWENPTDGEMMVSLLWYYRPEHTECGRQPDNCPEEVFSSIHQDANSVACIEDKCYVLSFNEYCRYRKQVKAVEENVSCSPSIVPSLQSGEVTNDKKIPTTISPDLVLFCRRIYDFRLKKIIDIKQKKKATN